MAHLELELKKDVASFRKLAIGTWQTAYDPNVYGSLTVRMEKALQYIEEFRQATGRRLTVTHLLTKACAAALKMGSMSFLAWTSRSSSRWPRVMPGFWSRVARLAWVV